MDLDGTAGPARGNNRNSACRPGVTIILIIVRFIMGSWSVEDATELSRSQLSILAFVRLVRRMAWRWRDASWLRCCAC
jgi:hypothetical protein